MRILVISRSAWDAGNNTGNTLQNFFADSPFEMYNLYMRAEAPGKNPCKAIFHITEAQLVRSLLRHEDCGAAVKAEMGSKDKSAAHEKQLYDKVKRHNFYLFHFLRELLWNMGKWKNHNLEDFLDEVKPDILFMPAFGCLYPYKILLHIQKLTGAKIVLFHADDNYSLRQFHFSPLYWLYRFRLRSLIRKAVKCSAANYCISPLQKKEYEKAFGVPCKLLQKFVDFSKIPPKKELSKPIKIVYTGNLATGRWKTLALIAEALKRINENGVRAVLYIYSATVLAPKSEKRLDDGKNSFFLGAVSPQEVDRVQNEADILLHAESFGRRDRFTVRQSFSTKIVDYFKRRRCLLAVGPKDVASMDCLITGKCAYTITTPTELTEKLDFLLSHPEEINAYAERSFQYGAENNGLDKRSAFYRELAELQKNENANC